MTRILIHSTDTQIQEVLQQELDPQDFEVSSVGPNPSFVQMFRQLWPHIVILDRVDEHQDVAQLEIAMIKDVNPDARIIVISKQSSQKDASLIEQGIFYYLTNSDHRELVRVIQAAVKSMCNHQKEVLE